VASRYSNVGASVSSIPFSAIHAQVVDSNESAFESCLEVPFGSVLFGALGLSGLAATDKLFGVHPPLPAEGSEVCATEGSGLDRGGQFVSSAPMLRSLALGRHQLALLLAPMAPTVETWDRNVCAAGELGYARPVGRTHALAAFFRTRDHRPFSWSSVRPLVDGSIRVDNFRDARGTYTVHSYFPTHSEVMKRANVQNVAVYEQLLALLPEILTENEPN
jgi:hypothetical protein